MNRLVLASAAALSIGWGAAHAQTEAPAPRLTPGLQALQETLAPFLNADFSLDLAFCHAALPLLVELQNKAAALALPMIIEPGADAAGQTRQALSDAMRATAAWALIQEARCQASSGDRLAAAEKLGRAIALMRLEGIALVEYTAARLRELLDPDAILR